MTNIIDFSKYKTKRSKQMNYWNENIDSDVLRKENIKDIIDDIISLLRKKRRG